MKTEGGIKIKFFPQKKFVAGKWEIKLNLPKMRTLRRRLSVERKTKS